MKAIVIRNFGPADVLQIEDVQIPVPDDHQVLVKVKAIGINPVDTKVRAGGHTISKSLQFPAILGWDISGVIEVCGKSVTGYKPGDAVFGNLRFPDLGNGYAEYVIAYPSEIAIKPQGVTFEEAAALPVAGLTAYQALHDHLHIQPRQNILIQAASGGVGHLAVQLAKIAGATVYATASTTNRDFINSIGADRYIDYTAEKFEDIISNYDCALDAMGGEVLYRSISCVKNRGNVVCLPSSTKNDPKAVELAQSKNINLVWPMMYKSIEQLALLAALADKKKLKIYLHKVFPFDQMADAHRQIETHHTRGKVVVTVDN